MGLLAIKVLGILALWSGVAVILGLSLGAVIRHVGRLGKQVARVELRKARRYRLSLPVMIHAPIQKVMAMRNGRTRDISARGVYFLTESDLKSGSDVNLTMTVPQEIAGGVNVFINVTGKVVRVQESLGNNNRRIGVAARIDRYEIVHGNAGSLGDKFKIPIASISQPN